MRTLSRRFPLQGVQSASAKFDSQAAEMRYRQPASPLLIRSDSSQHKSRKEKGNIKWQNKEQ
jgi:hypothetical protein